MRSPSHAIAARRDGNRIVIEDVEVAGEYGNVLTAQYLDAEAAIRFGDAVAAMGRRIVADRRSIDKVSINAPDRHLPLAVSYSPYPEDAK